MKQSDAWLQIYVLLAVSYAALVVAAALRRGPGRGFVAAGGVCGVLGTLVLIADLLCLQWSRFRLLHYVRTDVAEAILIAAFSSYVVAHGLLLVGLLRAWRAREALPDYDDPALDSSA